MISKVLDRTAVTLYDFDVVESEFITGKTQALDTLRRSDVRAVADSEILAVRPLDAA